MSIERTSLPLKIHKGVVAEFLRDHPDDFRQVAPNYPGTVEEYLAALEAAPGEWFVGGVLELPDGGAS